MSKRSSNSANVREHVLNEFKQQLALEKFQEERPQLWLQSQRLAKLIEIQGRLTDETFPEGSCFLHANTVSSSSFCIRKVLGVDLDTCQATIEIYGDEHLEAGVVVLPLETIEWFGFPAQAVSTGIHFEGFTGRRPSQPAPVVGHVTAAPEIPPGPAAAGESVPEGSPPEAAADRTRSRTRSRDRRKP